MRRFFFILFTFYFFTVLHGQAKDPNKILDELKDRFDKIKDYQVDAKIKVDVNFLKVPESKAQIYYKAPDKVKMDSEGFALLPKQGLNFSPAKLLKEDFSALYIRLEEMDGVITDVVKVIPNSDTSQVILSTLWIDSVEKFIRKIETTTKNSGTIQVEFYYTGTEKIGLPSQVKFQFKVDTPDLHTNSPGNESHEHNPARKQKGPMSGMVIIDYSNYKINQGISDSLFTE